MNKFKIFVCSLLLAASAQAKSVTIIVNSGNFGTVERAAHAEKQVNFWDDDFTDDRACTECYAAIELKNFLIKATDLKESDITFAGSKIFPAKGHVFIIGCKGSNQLLKNEPEFKSEQSFRILAKKDGDRIVTTIQGSDRTGTLYGVYRYLNKLGIRFYGLGETGTVFPAHPNKEIIVTFSIFPNVKPPCQV